MIGTILIVAFAVLIFASIIFQVSLVVFKRPDIPAFSFSKPYGLFGPMRRPAKFVKKRYAGFVLTVYYFGIVALSLIVVLFLLQLWIS